MRSAKIPRSCTSGGYRIALAACTALLVLGLGTSLVKRPNAAAELLSSYSAAERIQKARQEAAGVSDEKIEAEAQVKSKGKQLNGQLTAAAASGAKETPQPTSSRPASKAVPGSHTVVDEASSKGTSPGEDLEWLDSPATSTGGNDPKAATALVAAKKPADPVRAAASSGKADDGTVDSSQEGTREERPGAAGDQSTQQLNAVVETRTDPVPTSHQDGKLPEKFIRQLSLLGPQVIDDRQVDTGIIHQGNLARLRSYVHKLHERVPTSMAVVGGSITVGLGADGYGEVSFSRIQAAFGGNQMVFHNGAVGGVTSTYMTSCLKWHMPKDVDLVIVEYNVNDGFEGTHCHVLPCKIEYGNMNSPQRRAYERLLRKLLMLPHRPAVIMLQTFDFSKRMFMHSAEDQLGTFAQLYSLPWLSFRGVLWEKQQRGAKGYSVEDVMSPGGGDMHPNAYGHKMLADLVTALMARVGEGLLKRPFSPADQAVVDADILDPVLEGNIAWDAEYCIINEKLKSAVKESPGFEYVDESKADSLTRKWGFVATKPESSLLLSFSTASTTKGVADPHTVVTINHLKSYEHMGQAEVTCTGGCTCPVTILEGHWEQHNSQLSPHRISVSQALDCTLKIRVTNATSSGQHKVKIQGIVIADEATTADELPVLVPQIVPSDVMGAAKIA